MYSNAQKVDTVLKLSCGRGTRWNPGNGALQTDVRDSAFSVSSPHSSSVPDWVSEYKVLGIRVIWDPVFPEEVRPKVWNMECLGGEILRGSLKLCNQ